MSYSRFLQLLYVSMQFDRTFTMDKYYTSKQTMIDSAEQLLELEAQLTVGQMSCKPTLQ